MESRVSNEYNNKSTSVKEYAYLEDRNYPIRQNMEDSKDTIHHIDHFAIDGFAKDANCGLFAIFDGHGGSEVVEYAAKVTPDVRNTVEFRFLLRSLLKKIKISRFCTRRSFRRFRIG